MVTEKKESCRTLQQLKVVVSFLFGVLRACVCLSSPAALSCVSRILSPHWIGQRTPAATQLIRVEGTKAGGEQQKLSQSSSWSRKSPLRDSGGLSAEEGRIVVRTFWNVLLINLKLASITFSSVPSVFCPTHFLVSIWVEIAFVVTI